MMNKFVEPRPYADPEEGKNLVYIGKVGTGWSRTTSSQIRKKLDTVVSPKSKLTKPIRKPKATWVEPAFVAEVEYRDITSEGQPGSQGAREKGVTLGRPRIALAIEKRIHRLRSKGYGILKIAREVGIR